MQEMTLDPSLAFTVLLDRGALGGLTLDDADLLKTAFLNAWHAQEEIRHMGEFADVWLAKPQAERDADVAWAGWAVSPTHAEAAIRNAFIAGYLAREAS